MLTWGILICLILKSMSQPDIFKEVKAGQRCFYDCESRLFIVKGGCEMLGGFCIDKPILLQNKNKGWINDYHAVADSHSIWVLGYFFEEVMFS